MLNNYLKSLTKYVFKLFLRWWRHSQTWVRLSSISTLLVEWPPFETMVTTTGPVDGNHKLYSCIACQYDFSTTTNPSRHSKRNHIENLKIYLTEHPEMEITEPTVVDDEANRRNQVRQLRKTADTVDIQLRGNSLKYFKAISSYFLSSWVWVGSEVYEHPLLFP